MRLFFSYAHEDIAIVDAVYQKVGAAMPEASAWMARHEIRGGEDLFARIADGIETADKFFVFVSARSVDKPWVQLELRKALMAELQGVKPEFIVPVKIGTVTTFPAFLESRRYIDLQAMTEAEWIQEFRAIVLGAPIATPTDSSANLECQILGVANQPDRVVIVFRPQYWAQEIGFQINTSIPFLEAGFDFPGRKGMAQLGIRTKRSDKEYAIRIDNEKLVPPHTFWVWFRFHEAVGAAQIIEQIRTWDGADGVPSIEFMAFDHQG
jgi:hypothetical protein